MFETEDQTLLKYYHYSIPEDPNQLPVVTSYWNKTYVSGTELTNGTRNQNMHNGYYWKPNRVPKCYLKTKQRFWIDGYGLVELS